MNTLTIAAGTKDTKISASIYNLIINSNRTEQDVPLADFKKIVAKCLRGFESQEYITTNPGYDPDESIEISLRPKFEIGGKYHRVHAQIAATFIHNSNIKINIDAIKKNLPEGYNVWAPLQVLASRDLTRLLRYNAKQNL